MFTSALLVLLLVAQVPPVAAPGPAPQVPADPGPVQQPSAETCTYQGRPVTAAWIDQQYADFRDKVALADGKFYDIGKERLRKENRLHVGHVPPEMGEVRFSHSDATVLQVLESDSAIISQPGVLFRVRGAAAAKPSGERLVAGPLVDKAPFQEVMLIYAGTYRYIDTRQAVRTIQDFVVYQPITREQFVAALADSFRLTRYKIVAKKVMEVPPLARGGGAYSGFGAPTNAASPKKVTVDKEEIFAQSVPPPGEAAPAWAATGVIVSEKTERPPHRASRPAISSPGRQ